MTDAERIGKTKSVQEEREIERVLCPNCKQIFSMGDMVTHTVVCYRNSTKCKLCGEVILKDKKKEHLSKWRDLDVTFFLTFADVKDLDLY
jgi:RNase P subunit RPR2